MTIQWRGATTDTVLVTGAFGMVGTHTVQMLAADGWRVVATDIDTPSNRKAAATIPKRADIAVLWADLTDPRAANLVVCTASPVAIVHLAAIIPPYCYTRRAPARAVNVDATRGLIRTAETLANPPRFIQASSTAVYGSRNPFRHQGLLRADTPCRPSDIYGNHKVEAEESLKLSGLDWLVLRLGAVIPARPKFNTDLQLLEFDRALPMDGRVHTVEVRDVASAFAAAIRTDVRRQTLLIGGDNSHRLTQSQVTSDVAAAMGMNEVLPMGRPGDPDDDAAWFATDWMDTVRAQQLLNHQHCSWPDLLAECRDYIGWRRPLLRAAKPLLSAYFHRRSVHRDEAGTLADPWGTIDRRWGDHRPD